MALVIAGVPLAQYAAVTAALAEAFPLKTVLAVEGLDANRWAEADSGWTKRLGEDPELMAHYQTELAAAQSRLLSQEGGASKKRGGKVKLAASGTGLSAASTSNVAAPLPSSPPSPIPPQAAPQRAEERAAPEAIWEAPAPEERPAEAREEQPFRISEYPALAAAPKPAPAMRGRQVTVTAVAMPLAVLPFGSPQIAEEPRRPPPGRQVTLTVVAPVPAAVLPFESPPDAALEAPPPGRQVTLTVVAPVPAAVLPFESPPDAALEAPPPASDRSPPPSARIPAAPAPGASSFPSGGWGFVRAPAVTPASPASPLLSLEQHAALCLEIAVDPAHAADALARFQVTAADKERADEHYRPLIAADPDLHTRWNHAYEYAYHAWRAMRP